MQAIPLSALDLESITKPFRRLRELNLSDLVLAPAEVARLRAQLPALEELPHLPAGQLEEMIAQLDGGGGEDEMPPAGDVFWS